MSIPVRKSVKVLLLNENKEMLLMCVDDPKTTNVDGKYHGRFWFPVGGAIEEGESILEAATREIYEETGISKEEIELGPIVWHGEFDLILDGTLTRLNQVFLVAKTKKEDVSFANLTPGEQKTAQKLKWFSLDMIRNCDEVIYPIVLLEYLPDVMLGKYPKSPIEIDLAKQPSK